MATATKYKKMVQKGVSANIVSEEGYENLLKNGVHRYDNITTFKRDKDNWEISTCNDDFKILTLKGAELTLKGRS